MEKFDLIVIGSGPAGEKAAVKAAYFGYRVALIEKQTLYGGAGVLTGTLPSKTLKETALYLSGKNDKGLYGIDRALSGDATVENFLFRKNLVIETEAEAVRQNLLNHEVKLYHGTASFDDAHHVRVKGHHEEVIYGEYIIIATGSYPFHPTNIPFDHLRVNDSDSILNISKFPRSIAILGAGVIGLEYATIFSTMGSKVHLINRNDKILSFIDHEIVEEFIEHLKHEGIDLLFNKSVKTIDIPQDLAEPLSISLESGELLKVDMFLYAAGRNGSTKDLRLEKLGIQVDNRENIPVNSMYQTSVPNIYAVGDVIGFPALASASMDQGRVAVTHIFKTNDLESLSRLIPYGIYTIPEISTAGLSEADAEKAGLSYCTGAAHHANMPRGKIMGVREGMLKLVFMRDTQVIIGVHIIGPIAIELIHHGMALIEGKKTLGDVIGNVYNCPTLHELYKYAAYDGLGNLAGHKVKTS